MRAWARWLQDRDDDDNDDDDDDDDNDDDSDNDNDDNDENDDNDDDNYDDNDDDNDVDEAHLMAGTTRPASVTNCLSPTSSSPVMICWKLFTPAPAKNRKKLKIYVM